MPEDTTPPAKFWNLDDVLLPADLTVRQALTDQIRDNPEMAFQIHNLPAEDDAMMLNMQFAFPIATALVKEVMAIIESEASGATH